MNTIAPDQTFELKYGETKIKADYGLSIRLDSVLNDSPYPEIAGIINQEDYKAEVRITKE